MFGVKLGIYIVNTNNKQVHISDVCIGQILKLSWVIFKEFKKIFMPKTVDAIARLCHSYSSIVLEYLNPLLQLWRTDVTAFCMQFDNSEDR